MTHFERLIGPGLEPVARLDVLSDDDALSHGTYQWLLRGVISHERYVHHAEQIDPKNVQPALARPQATCAALIPVQKSAAWWSLAQDERRAIFETRSHHIRTVMQPSPQWHGGCITATT